MHYHPGRHPIAFVFSAPGAREKASGMPVSGMTGENLQEALALLAQVRPDLFPSADRYDYRITNAFVQPLARSLGDRRTEATRNEILAPDNVARVKRELEGMRCVVLCGDKAAHLAEALAASAFRVVRCSHTSNQALVSCHNDAATGGATPSERRKLRSRAWALFLLARLEPSSGS